MLAGQGSLWHLARLSVEWVPCAWVIVFAGDRRQENALGNALASLPVPHTERHIGQRQDKHASWVVNAGAPFLTEQACLFKESSLINHFFEITNSYNILI
jgi:hypothetical protein